MKRNWMEKNGFADIIYIVRGGNTYLIKDELKTRGFRYKKHIGWYSSILRPVPAGYELYCVPFDELYLWEEQHNQAFPYANITEKIKNIIYINKEKE